MKIGIVTLYNASNYGAYLQVYAMQSYLKSLEEDVEVINYYKPFFTKYHYLISRPARVLMEIRKQLVYRKDKKKLNVKRCKNKKYDIIFLGSDEIWNINNKSFLHAKELFGQGIQAKRKIAYAPSCGFTKPEEIYNNDKYRSAIQQLDNVYARDNNTKLIAEHIFKRECLRVVDPTFLYLDQWENELEEVKNIDEDFILYYSYHDDSYAKKDLLKFAKKNNLKIYSIGFNYKWCDKSLIVSPKQFLYLMNKAKFVATTTFHGTIFCNVFKKKYVVFKANSKTTDLLDMIEAKESRYYSEGDNYEKFEGIITTEPDYKKIYDILHDNINKSKAIIEKEINNAK